MRKRINRSASKIRGGDVIILPLQGITVTVGNFVAKAQPNGSSSTHFCTVTIVSYGSPCAGTLHLSRHEATQIIYGWIRKEEAAGSEVLTDRWPGASKLWVLEGRDVSAGRRYRLHSGHKVQVIRNAESQRMILHHENCAWYNPSRTYTFQELLNTLNQCRAKPLVRHHAL